MRAILSILFLFSGTPDDMTAESLNATDERKVERYRILLSELVSSTCDAETKTPTDLPEGLKEAIEGWTRDEG
jgi:hypothetical protein